MIKTKQTEFDESEFCSLYATHSNKALAQRYNVGISTIFRWAVKLNVKRDDKFEQLDQLQFKHDYLNSSLRNVAIKYRVHISTIGNWARRLNIHRKSNQWKDLDITLTGKQMEIIIGSLLGDGCLVKVKGKGNSRFSEVHGEKQAEWVKWKQKQLEPIPSRYYEKSVVARKNLGKGQVINDPTRRYLQCSMRTINYPIFTELEHQWYARNENGSYKKKHNGLRIKCIPKNIKLTPLIVAVWFMDDGCNQSKRKSATLHPLDFTHEEVFFLNEQIKTMGFESKIINGPGSKPGQFSIYIGEKSYLNFIEMIRVTLSDIPDCMKYKTDISEYKLSWKKSSEYHPRSLFNDEVVQQIMEDAKTKMPQRQIAEKYGINYKLINRLLKGKSMYKSEFADKPNYRSTSGVEGVCWQKDRQSYLAQITLPREDKKPLHLCLGYYADKDVATIVANTARKMRDDGVTDPAEYKRMKAIYKSPVRRTNKSGINGVSFNNTHQNWTAGIGFDGARVDLGTYKIQEQAVEIRRKAEAMLTAGIRNPIVYAKLRSDYKLQLKE